MKPKAIVLNVLYALLVQRLGAFVRAGIFVGPHGLVLAPLQK